MRTAVKKPSTRNRQNPATNHGQLAASRMLGNWRHCTCINTAPNSATLTAASRIHKLGLTQALALTNYARRVPRSDVAPDTTLVLMHKRELG